MLLGLRRNTGHSPGATALGLRQRHEFWLGGHGFVGRYHGGAVLHFSSLPNQLQLFWGAGGREDWAILRGAMASRNSLELAGLLSPMPFHSSAGRAPFGDLRGV